MSAARCARGRNHSSWDSRTNEAFPGGDKPARSGEETRTVERVLVDDHEPEPTGVAALVENGIVHGGDSPGVEVSARKRRDRVAVEVADDGPGIPRSVRGPVFEDSDITQLQHNTGIGLWLARWVVEACGGQLGYERRDGRTRVRLWLRPAESAVDRPSDDG